MSDELTTQPESGAERQANEVIRNILADHPLPEPQQHETPRQEGVYALSSQEARRLHCVALIRDGQVIPLVDLTGQPSPKTPGEKMHAFALVARTILDGLMEALEFWEYRRKAREDDEGGIYHA